MTTETDTKKGETTEQPAATKSKSTTGLDENLGGLLAYAFTFISGLILFLLEKENEYIRFHALQSLIAFGGLMVGFFIISLIPVIGLIFSILFTPLWVVLWIFMMYKGYKGERYKLPFAGYMTEKQLNKDAE
ncbi:MAG: DUF4870 domain-containing protein [Bacillus sp. (in: Bacteria)]|nr:DUF4870 domain-containing protein [Bacillus sp. (in: firmicutes)]